MSFKIKRGRPKGSKQTYKYRNFDSYGNIFPSDYEPHEIDKENNRLILKKKE